MTNMLQKAFNAASQLPETDQDAIAALVLEEIASDTKWAESFKNSQDWLEKAAEKALADFKAGKTRELNLDEL